MTIEDCILVTYPIVHPYESIKSIGNRLKEKDYLVVKDEENKFYGILTPADVLTRPYNLVIDCLTPKGIIQTDDSFGELVGKFEKTPSEALPVFHRDKYVGILEKSHAIKKLKSRLDDFRQESMISQNIKSVFLQNISHEVRTPLNHILGFMSIVADLSPEEIEPNRKEFYAIIQKSSEQFLSTMNDLIELSRLYSGDSVHVNNEISSIESIFSGIKESYEGREILYSGELNISYHNPDAALMMYTDSKKLKLIIHRLINWIIKQTQKAVSIEFGYELFMEKQKICFYVKKTNVQITDTPRNRPSGTTGRSLYAEHSFQYESDFSMELAKKMVELLGGTIDLEKFETDIKTIYFTFPYNSSKSVDDST